MLWWLLVWRLFGRGNGWLVALAPDSRELTLSQHNIARILREAVGHVGYISVVGWLWVFIMASHRYSGVELGTSQHVISSTIPASRNRWRSGGRGLPISGIDIDSKTMEYCHVGTLDDRCLQVGLAWRSGFNAEALQNCQLLVGGLEQLGWLAGVAATNFILGIAHRDRRWRAMRYRCEMGHLARGRSHDLVDLGKQVIGKHGGEGMGAICAIGMPSGPGRSFKLPPNAPRRDGSRLPVLFLCERRWL
ncbi:uncharacterized protein BJ171DRAFT_507376, partial [Polychytrium aggregatum]|uniref:uncharacterized protein n=1 Tax=Polychytrium aggregatum TaxID=110093 RepID=UPI0022FE601E